MQLENMFILKHMNQLTDEKEFEGILTSLMVKK